MTWAMKIKWDFHWSGWRKHIPGGTTEQRPKAPAMSMPSAAIFCLVTVGQGGQTEDKTGSLSVHLDGLHFGVAALWPGCAHF